MPKRIYLRKYVNNNSHSKAFGRTYGRVKHYGIISTEELARHMADHGSLLTEDVTLMALKKLSKCVLEQLLEGYKVKLDGLGIFYIGAQTVGEEQGEDFNEGSVKALRVKFVADSDKNADWGNRAVKSAARLTMTNPLLLENETVDGGDDGSGGGDDDGEEDRP